VDAKASSLSFVSVALLVRLLLAATLLQAVVAKSLQLADAKLLLLPVAAKWLLLLAVAKL
jgi:hypothetical protein